MIANCPVDMTLSPTLTCDTIVTWTNPTITDNCDMNVNIAASHNSGDTFSAGTTTVTYTATDASGNVANCSFDITVTDTDAPVFANCPTDMTISAGGCQLRHHSNLDSTNCN